MVSTCSNFNHGIAEFSTNVLSTFQIDLVPNPSALLFDVYRPPQAMQSSIRSVLYRTGKVQAQFWLFGKLACKYLIGDGTFNKNKRRWPARIAEICRILSVHLISTLSLVRQGLGTLSHHNRRVLLIHFGSSPKLHVCKPAARYHRQLLLKVAELFFRLSSAHEGLCFPLAYDCDDQRRGMSLSSVPVPDPASSLQYFYARHDVTLLEWVKKRRFHWRRTSQERICVVWRWHKVLTNGFWQRSIRLTTSSWRRPGSASQSRLVPPG